jgi:hypothetical protein
MAKSTLVLYEPLGSMTENSYYWTKYVQFYEQYWGGTTSPFGVWFGNEYESFIIALSGHLGIDAGEVEHCFFTKDEEGKYYIAPFNSKSNLFFCENFIPVEWFILFSENERQTLYTHWGFNALHYDTRVHTALERLNDAEAILSEVLSMHPGDLDNSVYIYIEDNLLRGLTDLKAWLSGFDPSGFVVLNYGELCSAVNPYSLEREHSVEEAWNILRLLREGNFRKSVESLNTFLRKWDDIRSSASGELDNSTIQ